MIIDKSFLDTLSAQAKANPRLRQNYDLRISPANNSQRMLNALEPGTVMPVHRHMKTSESIAMIRGKVAMRLYDDHGTITDEFVMAPAGSVTESDTEPVEVAEVPMVQVEAGRWHSLEVLDEGTVLFEAKDGKYEPMKEEDVTKLNT